MKYSVYQKNLNSQCGQGFDSERIAKLEKAVAEQAKAIEALASNSGLKEQFSPVLALDGTEIFKAANVNMQP